MYQRVMRTVTIIGGLALATLFTFYILMVIGLGEAMGGESGTLSDATASIATAIDVIVWPAHVLRAIVPAWRSYPATGAAFALASSLVWGLVLYVVGRTGAALYVKWATRPILR